MITEVKKKKTAKGSSGIKPTGSESEKNFIRGGRTGFRHYERSHFLSGSDISDRSFYSRGN